MANEQQRRDVRQELTDELIKLVEVGMAPWQKPWDAKSAAKALQLPQNPVTGKAYRGGNSIQLMVAGFHLDQGVDPRWCTYKQAQSQGWQVKKGAKAQSIQYWKWEHEEQRTNPVTGASESVSIKNDAPTAFYASVFHASQIEGIPPYLQIQRTQEPWETIERADEIVAKSGARIFHDQLDRAFYAPHADEVHIPPRSAFATPLDYYEVLLHEIGHWSGHSSRLNRDLSGNFGSPSYAREELRAQLASLFLSAEMGIPYNPQRHAAYQASWVEVLKKDKNEIYQAASQAHQIAEYVMGLAISIEQRPQEDTNSISQDLQNNAPRISLDPAMGIPMSTTDSFQKITTDQVEQALAYISASIGRDEWIKIAMAIKSQFPGEEGFLLFERWSQSGDNYKAASAVSAWRSIKAEGGITIASLFKEAIHHGFRPEENTRVGLNRDEAKLHGSQNTKGSNDSMLKAAKQEQTAQQAIELWQTATTPQRNAYLERKGVGSHGLRCLPNGVLLIPLVDEDGKLWNLQRILPSLPKNATTDKFYLKDGRKTGLFHLIGEIATDRPILFAEGYATAASLYEATGHPVVVTFDSGNLVRVAKLFRGFYPNKTMVICGDDDVANTHNTGRNKATEAGNAIQARVIFPAGPHFTGKDFNDLIGQYGRAAGTQLITGLMGEGFTPQPSDGERSAAMSSQHENMNTVTQKDQQVGWVTPAKATLTESLISKLQSQFWVADNKFYFRDKSTSLAFTDNGRSFQTAHTHLEVIQAIAALAAAKGWKQLHLQGSEEFKRRAWLEASLLGLKVSGYQAHAIDQTKLNERVSLQKADIERQPTDAAHKNQKGVNESEQAAPKSTTQRLDHAASIEKAILARLNAMGETNEAVLNTTLASLNELINQPRAYVGEILEHGPAPYKFNPEEKLSSYFVKLKTDHGIETVWGVDIGRALAQSAPRSGETVILVHQGSEPALIKVDVKNQEGQVIGQEEVTTKRNAWFARSLAELHEEAQAGVLIKTNSEQPSPALDHHIDSNTQSKGLQIVARALAIRQVPQDIATSSLAAVAETLQQSQNTRGKPKQVRIEKHPSLHQRVKQSM